MKTSMKIAALAAVTVVFAGCASKPDFALQLKKLVPLLSKLTKLHNKLWL